jgi:1-acyl-sn-glycerol-3-phosphate acyltransferase
LEGIIYKNDIYKTGFRNVSLMAKIMPSFIFYCKILPIIFKAGYQAKRCMYDSSEWAKSSLAVFRALESVGIKVEITGIENFKTLDSPCVFVANHMSTLETFVLPSIIAPFMEVTFVVKKSLVEYPVFKHVMRSRNPVTVGRTNPRDDLKAVLEGGAQRLKDGISIIIFPQSTRASVFDPSKFNTLGTKLAKRANVPIVPIALKTEAWSEGKYLKDLGRIFPSKDVYFAFGKPILVKDRGDEEHCKIIEFISSKLREWNK